MYNYLDSITSDHTLIYQFSPAGSRNLANISELRPRTQNTHESFVRTVPMLMHDQEPLDPDYYNNSYLQENLSNWYRATFPGWETFYNSNPDIREHRNAQNLAALFDGTGLYDTFLLCHSEYNSRSVQFYEQLGFHSVFWWSHAVIARDWYRYAQIDPLLKTNQEHKLHFNIYNRAWKGTREYRIKFTDLMISTGLAESSNITFNPVDTNTHYQDHEYRNSAFQPRNDLSVLPVNRSSSHSSAGYNAQDYADTWIDVVLETVFDDQRVHLTEKILRPIACGKPFVLAAGPGSLEFLKHYGFRTFEPWIDEGYDKETDSSKRLQRIVYALKRARDISDNASARQQLQEIADYNQRRFFSERFFEQVVNEFKNNYTQALEKVEHSLHGQRWYHFWCTARRDPELKKILMSDNEYRTRTQLAEQLRFVRSQRSK